ncbi:hypothetical protein Leryth_022321 [Lithospermum erythrorhizon]|nr:hypothetical protein Leryth_022321 [Lithospermum erythrorhizon]
MYLKSEEGRKFVVFMFGLSGQLVKEVLAMVKSQIPFGRKSMLEAYGEIVFKAWKAMEGEAKDEIENGFLQGLIESAIYAGTLQLCSSIRRVLGWFISQRTVEGVEKLLFRLAEPLIFRSLQVANSNVRQNALNLLLDLFPFEDPDATKDVKDSLFEKQFYLLEKLVMDECSGVRVVAVEGCSRILNMFWEIIPSQIITKIITNFFDQMSYDSSTEVRLSTVNGIIYLLGNPLSHEVLKVLLPRLRHLIDDDAVSVRSAVVDLLLCLNDIRNFQFHKVVPLDLLLSKLATDQPLVGKKITKLLIPSYFPEKVSEEEACKRCLMLVKRSPTAGARFCEFSLSEGTSLGSLMKLFELLLSFILSPEKLAAEHLDALLTAASCLCKHLVNNKNFKVALRDNLSSQNLKHLFAIASTAQAQSSVCDIVSAISPDAVDDLFEDCMKLILNCSGLTDSTEKQGGMRAAHKMVISCNWFEDMLEAIAVNLQKTVSACNFRFSRNTSGAKKRSKSSKKLPKTIKSFDDDYAIAAGLAWQIKDLLVSGNTRNVVLLSPHLVAVFNAVKAISEISILQCMQCDAMSASPVSAYTALALHMSLNNISINGSKTPNVKRKHEKPAVELTMDNIFSCTNKLFRPDASGMCGPIATNGKRVSNLLKILTAIMKFTVDTAMMDLISSCREISLKFLLKCIQFVVFNLKKFSSDLMQLRKEEITTVFHCLKSSITYSAKFLNVAFANSSEDSSPTGCYHLANELLNIIVTAEECLGYMYAVRLHAVIKPWMPDIIISLGSLHLLNPASVETIATDDAISSCPIWLSVLAKVELCELIDSAADKVSQEEGFIAFRKLMKMILEQLRMNYDVLDAVGSALLGVAQLALERSDLDLLLGLLCFICVKLIKCDDQHQGHLKTMLAMLDNMYHLIEAETEKPSINGDSSLKLQKAKALLEQIWMNYSYNDSEEQMEEM